MRRKAPSDNGISPNSERPFSHSISRISAGDLVVAVCLTVITLLSGCGVTVNPVPHIALSPESLSWHNVNVGQTSAAKTVTVTNTSSLALTISSIQLSPEFIQTGTTCPSAPATVPAGGSCTISVAFRPESTGPKTGSLTIADNALGNPHSVSLSAKGAVGSLIFDPTSLSFPGVASGTISQPQNATLTNKQSTPIAIQGFTVSGHFAEGNNCPISPNTLAAGESCTVTVVSKPTAGGSMTGSVNVKDAFGNVTQLYLSGSDSGNQKIGSISFSPVSLTWGNVIVGQTSGSKTITVTNNQSTSLAISYITTGPDFIQTGTTCPIAPATVPAGGSCTISVAFRPNSSGPKTELLTLIDNASGSPHSALLNATGSTGSLLFSPVSLSFAGVDPGKTSAAQKATLTNETSGAIALASITVSGHFAETNDCPGTLASQSSCTFNVTSNPVSNGTFTGSVNVRDGSGTTTQLYLKGLGGTSNQVSFSPDSLLWGKIAVGQTSGPKTITLTNNQTSPLTISSIAVGQDFVLTATTCPTAPTTVAPGASCTLSMAFRPLSAGQKNQAITITDDAAGGLQSVSLDGTGIIGSLLFDPSSLSFAGVQPNTVSQAQTATLTNETASTAITLASITVSGHFAQTNDCPGTLSAGQHCTVTVTSNPVTYGSTAGSINVKDGANNTTQLYLSGMGGIPANIRPVEKSDVADSQASPIYFAPASLSWGAVSVGQTSGAKTVTLNNSQTTPLTISSITVGPDFVQTANTCPITPATLAGGASCAVSVAFRPASSGAKNESVTFAYNASGSPQTVPLSATGTIGSLLYNASSLSFAAVAPGSVSPAQSSTLTNELSTPITLTSITVSGHFAQTNNCPITPNTLAAGASCTVTVTANPVASGTFTGSVNAKDSTGAVTQLYLTGSGGGSTGGGGSVTLSPASHNFPDQGYGSSSAPYAFTLTNGQSTAVSISSISVSTTDFSQTNNCGTSLAAGASCTISVSFAPQSTGYKTATLSISDNASGSPQTASLSGNGVNPVVVSPLQYTFPNQAAGTTSLPATITVTNKQSSALTVTAVQIAAPFQQTNNCVGTVPAGGSCTISVTYAPTSVGYSSKTLTITDNASTSPQTVTIAGNSYAPVKLSNSSLGFGNQIVNRSSTPQTVTLTNNQPTPLTINSITSTGSAFAVTNTCIPSGSSSGSLPGNSSCTINVVFTPTSAGTFSGSFTVTNNAYGSPETVTYIGTGITADTGTGVEITPRASCVLPSQTQKFAATVRNNTNKAVTWYVDNVKNGSSGGGYISTSGLYTAPSTTGSHTVKAVSQAETTAFASTQISVTTNPNFAIYPFTASIPVSGQQTFQGQICSVPDNNVTYTVDGIAGGNATVGTITTDGVYTAPNTPGKHIVRVTDATLNKGSGAVVTVYSNVAVDFGSRTNQQHPVPAGILGVNHVDGLHNPTDMGMITSGGFTISRTYALVPDVYATQTPDWSKIDPLIANLQTLGMHVVLEVAYTPVWLQPNPNPCGAGNTTAVPTDINKWAQLAASYVAHMDQKFPGVVTDYEIWNEPDAGGICGNVNRLNAYLAIYAAAAPLMKQQAAADGATIRVGGPTTSGMNPTWIPALLSNPSTAPYVDFVSYHNYTMGTLDVDATWDSYNGNSSLYQMTQGPGGPGALYAKASTLVAAGKQPLGANTPIYIDEYNTNWAFIQECCRNNPTYSPIWNALYVSDLLNTVYTGTTSVPGGLAYFAASNYPYFCLIGTWDSQMDCQYTQGSTPEPYPQYYAYQLMASPSYLGLNSGGYMAASISPPSGAGGLVTTAFYTANQDSVLIVNPTATTYSAMTITLQNTGFTSPHAVVYQIVDGQTINSSSLALTQSNGTYTANIQIPAYSVMGIAIQGP
jgi:hypothetical protein